MRFRKVQKHWLGSKEKEKSGAYCGWPGGAGGEHEQTPPLVENSGPNWGGNQIGEETKPNQSGEETDSEPGPAAQCIVFCIEEGAVPWEAHIGL